jgi:deoxyribodipyrimidine photo-lyase
VIPCFIWSPDDDQPWPPGGASRWWLHQSLTQFQESLRRVGSRLILRSGPTVAALTSLIEETGATAVFWVRRYEPAARRLEEQVQRALQARGVATAAFSGVLLFEPEAIRTQTGKPYQVFSAFWRRCLREPEPEPTRPAPTRLPAPTRWPASVELAELRLEPTIDWAGGLRETWQPGEAGAHERLRRFLAAALRNYDTGRNRPDWEGTSRLSPHLHFGEISPRQVWTAVRQTAARSPTALDVERYLTELGWREFAHHLLFHLPHTPEQPLRQEFNRFPWVEDRALLRAWQRGRTGYPIVDAGMRQLWHTGWMHNRVRMIVASFLTKDLLLSWQHGAKWFWDTLVDADLANNTLGWQWTAGCGADAAPYFRIFNPVSQGKRFDPDGAYVRRWVPELARLPNRWIHRPWEAPASVLKQAAVTLGTTYPRPAVNHAAARARAREAFHRMSAERERV